MLLLKGIPCSTGNFICRRNGLKTKSDAGKQAYPRRCSFRPSHSLPGRCWIVLSQPKYPASGSPQTRSMVATVICAGGWKLRNRHLCWQLPAMSLCGLILDVEFDKNECRRWWPASQELNGKG